MTAPLLDRRHPAFASLENEAEGTAAPDARAAPSGRWLLAGAGLALAAAGLMLWARDGETVFASHLLSALAWCF